MNKKINIAIADDHDLVVSGFIALLGQKKELSIAFTAQNGKDVLAALKKNVPDILLLDLDMPVMTGNEAFDIIKKTYPKLKIIIISGTFNPAIVFKYVKKEANSFLPKNCSLEELMLTINKVMETGRYFNKEVSAIVAKELSNPSPPDELVEFTSEEREMLRYLAQGLTNKECAAKMNLDIRAAEWVKSCMFMKIGTNNLNVLLVYAAKHNLV